MHSSSTLRVEGDLPEGSELKQQPHELKQENYAVVRIWNSKNFNLVTKMRVIAKGNPSYNVGHASLEVNCGGQNAYLSLWPVKSIDPKMVAKNTSVESKLHTLDQDKKAECRCADRTFLFFSLKADQMYRHVERLKKHYNMKGKASGDTQASNCSSAVYDVLKTGGIKELISSKTQVSDPLTAIISPDSLVKPLEEARDKERELHQQTVLWEYELWQEPVHRQPYIVPPPAPIAPRPELFDHKQAAIVVIAAVVTLSLTINNDFYRLVVMVFAIAAAVYTLHNSKRNEPTPADGQIVENDGHSVLRRGH